MFAGAMEFCEGTWKGLVVLRGVVLLGSLGIRNTAKNSSGLTWVTEEHMDGVTQEPGGWASPQVSFRPEVFVRDVLSSCNLMKSACLAVFPTVLRILVRPRTFSACHVVEAP